MSQVSVADVMTHHPVSVDHHQPYQDVIRLMRQHSVSAVPVVDQDRRVLGLVSVADLAHRLESVVGTEQATLFHHHRHYDRRKAAAAEAGELMTWPAVTVPETAPVFAAANLMTATDVRQLPVVDDLGRLVGMVSGRDLITVLLHPVDAFR